MLTKKLLEEVATILVSGDCAIELERIVLSHKDLHASVCPKSPDGKHKVFIGMTGDCWPQFCTNGCRMVSNEGDPDIDWENF